MKSKDKLTLVRSRLSEAAKPVYAEMKSYELLLKEAQRRWERVRKAYERVDRKLAALDGRTTIVSSNTHSPKQVQVKSFTLAQLQEIAEKLGVKL